MNRNSRLYHEKTKALCSEIKTILSHDNEKYVELAKAISRFKTESRLVGIAYDSLKTHMSDYILVIGSVIKANELIMQRAEWLQIKIGNEDFNGDVIFDEIERAERNISIAYQNAANWRSDKARWESEHSKCVSGILSIFNPYSGSNPYDAEAENYKRIKEFWESKKATYDEIDDETSDYFSESIKVIKLADVFLKEIRSREVDGAIVKINSSSEARKNLLQAYSDISLTLKEEKTVKDDISEKTKEEINDFWLNNDCFDNPYWYQDETTRALALEYLRREIEVNGPYKLLREGEQTEEERIVHERKMILIKLFANAPTNAAFDHLLGPLETTCAYYGEDLYDGIGYNEKGEFVITSEFLVLLEKNWNRRIGKEFGYWCDRGGGEIIDGMLVFSYGAAYTLGAPATQTEGLTQEEIEIDITRGNQELSKPMEGKAETPTNSGSEVIEVTLSRNKYPESSQHIEEAIKEGQPDTLTIDRGGASSRRKASLKGVDPAPGLDRDEYPPAMSREGGTGASVKLINPSDNRGSGASISGQLRKYSDGTKFRIKITDED